MVVRFFPFEKYHNKRFIGSTRIRVHNLIKHWDDADVYKYAENPDVLIYQKVYTTYEYKFPQHFENIQILDVCDPDFKDTPDVFIKESMDAMDAVVVPTETFKTFLEQMTDTPIVVIKDRFDLTEFPPKKEHKGTAKTCVWFGYSHNAGALRMAIQSLEKRGLKLICVSDEDPMPFKWADNPKEYEKKYKWIKYQHPMAYKAIQKADICILPPNNRPFEHFKSENKTVIAKLLGLPVAKDADELDALMSAEARSDAINTIYDKLKQEYDCHKSVEEYLNLINNIKEKRDGKS